MLALQVRQKDAEMYLVSYPAGDLLNKVKFESRVLPGKADDPVPAPRRIKDRAQQFIHNVVESDQGFQRKLIKKKVHAIRDFVRLCEDQPPIPSTVLLYTPEKLSFRTQGRAAAVGDLAEPREPFTIVDGQHRLAGLKLHLDAHPEEADSVHVPVAVFDGKSADFAAEMFVIVNSTHSKISKSLLIDLMERVRTATREELVAARVVGELYKDASSPLRYRINRLGGRSDRDKWILQSQLYSEISRMLSLTKPEHRREFCLQRLGLKKLGERPHRESARLDEVAGLVFRLIADWYVAAARAFGECWESKEYMFTQPATLQAILRVLGDELRGEGLVDAYLAKDLNSKVFDRALTAAWGRYYVHYYFRAGAFHDRFPAKNNSDRIRLIHEWLGTELQSTR